MHLVPDELVLGITATGTLDEARAKVEEYERKGCTCPCSTLSAILSS